LENIYKIYDIINSFQCKEQIESDQRKQLIAHSECSYEKVFSLLEGRDKNSLRELLTYQDSDGYTALHRAAYTNQLAIVRLLLSFEKQPGLEDLHQLHKKTEMGWTPFHSAAFWNAYEVVDYFIKYAPDCDVNAQTNSGEAFKLILLAIHQRIAIDFCQ